MHIKFIAIILASALAISGLSAAPAQAQSQGNARLNNGQLLASAAAVAVLGAAIAHERSRNDNHHGGVSRDRHHAPVYLAGSGNRHKGHNRGHRRDQGFNRGHRRDQGFNRGHRRDQGFNRGHRRDQGFNRGHRSPHGSNRSHNRHRGEARGHSRGFNGHAPVTRHALPGGCRVQSGSRSGYSGRCLSRNYSGYDALPQQCAVRVGGRHGTVYRNGCLRQYGY